ncbi:CxC2 domain-containing protein [Mycena kentingensis (nom. inval.)]|nr:CxC2 domain-containing protein [Mycena kentingensis (nom. inval.)]
MQHHQLPLPLPPLDATMAVNDSTEEGYSMALWEGDDEDEDEDVPEVLLHSVYNSVNLTQDRAMYEWSSGHRDEFLRVLLWHDGRKGMGGDGCRRCMRSSAAAEYRCPECGDELVCKACCCAMHQDHPLHWIERWNGRFFDRVSLRSLGFRVQLGHRPREPCSVPTSSHTDFTILHRNGIHHVAVDFCACHLRQDPYHVQLLRYGWYPATPTNPRTAATFQCLATFHALSVKGKITAYDYYGTLEHLTDGSGLKPTDRYKPFLRMVRQWRHLFALKRAGRGHADDGVAATQLGELALRCPACPRPDVNLPPNWQAAPPEQQCLYIMYIAIDACFRLKRRMISSFLKDPCLAPGWAYMVAWGPYRDYLAATSVQKEVSTCTGLAALDHANTKFSRGYSATGVAMCICARHEFVLPNGVGDLQKGERFANTDYILASTLRFISILLRLMISYDIACQWWKSLRERLLALPPHVRLSIAFAMVRFVIPKMHIKAHTLACQLLFSLYLALGSGQTDGEGIERLWAMCGAIAASTKLSGPGARADQLDDHWGFWNWMKLVSLAALLRRRLDNAIREREKQEEAFSHFNSQQTNRIPVWLSMVDAFEAPRAPDGPEPPNPYQPTVNGLTEQEVPPTRIHDVSPIAFVTFALELEHAQFGVQAELKRSKSSSTTINLGSMRRRLNKSIHAPAWPHWTFLKQPWPKTYPFFFPPASYQSIARLALQPLSKSRSSSAKLNVGSRSSSCVTNSISRSAFWCVINRNESKVKLRADKYQIGRRALCALLGKEPDGFPELRKRDIRCMADAATTDSERVNRAKDARRVRREAALVAAGDLPLYALVDTEDPATRDDNSENDDVAGESRRVMSWIWSNTGGSGTDADMEDALRIEWCKAYARVRRWREEVLILQEEWRRLPISLAYEAERWDQRAKKVSGNDASAEGRVAYARKQQALYRDLIRRAEETRTAPKIKRGHSRRTQGATTDMDMEDDESVASENESDDQRGDLDSEDDDDDNEELDEP